MPSAEGGWVPVPDPTELTARAVNSAKEDLRREIQAVRDLEHERWVAHADVHREQLQSVSAASAALRDRLEQAEENRRLLHQQDLNASQRALDELKRTTEKRFDQIDDWRSDVGDQLAGFPSRAENRSALDAVTISIASLNDKLATQITAMAALTGTYVTKDQLEAQERVRETDRRETRRAMMAALSSAAIALIGWIITLVLFLLSHKTGG